MVDYSKGRFVAVIIYIYYIVYSSAFSFLFLSFLPSCVAMGYLIGGSDSPYSIDSIEYE